jgi:hypothetical protein
MKTTAVALAALIAGVSACSSNSAGSSTASSAPRVHPTATRTAAASRCIAVPVAQAQRLAEGAERGVGKMTFTAAAAVKSSDFKSVYMIAGRFRAPGVDEVGVWASNKLPIGGGLLLAVDGVAKQFTVWPDGDKSSAGVSSTDDGVAEARDCL